MLGGGTAVGGYAGYTAAIPSLCVPALKLEDNSAGVGDGAADITAFPDGEALAATWDLPLAQEYGAAVGEEQSAKGTNVVLGPMINVMRDPRWGRNYETFSEDPYLTGEVGDAEVEGIQSQGVIAEVKHIGAYMQEYSRTNVNSVLTRRALEEIYQKPFQMAVDDADAGAIMAAADYTNGVYDNADPLLLAQDADTAWQFQGFANSDWDTAHSVDALQAGLDLSMPSASNFGAPLQAAVVNGTVPIAYVNDAVSRILREMFVHGLFEHPDTGDLSAPARTAAHVQLAQQVSEESTVLLKNADSQLPLNAHKVGSVAVIGQAGSAAPKAEGCGSGAVSATNVVTPLDGIKSVVGSRVQVGYADGSDQSAATKLAAGASVAVVFANDEECEQGGASYDDRTSLDLGSTQDQLIERVAAANPHTVVVLDTGSPVTMPWLHKVAAVLEAWYPGQTDGTAIASLLFGDSNPSGHLTQTWPRNPSQMPTASTDAWGNSSTDNFYEGIDVGYRWDEVHNFNPLFPFGYGLSYTKFAFSSEVVSERGGGDDPVFTVSATVRNVGSRAGADVAQLYVGDPQATGEPPKQLEGFTRVSLAAGQSQRITFTVSSSDLSFWDGATNGWAVDPGTYRFLVGDSVTNTPLHASQTLRAALGATSAAVSSPAQISALTSTNINTTVTVGGNLPEQSVASSLVVPAGWNAKPLTTATFKNVRPGAKLVTRWQVTAPASAGDSLAQLDARALLQAGSSEVTLNGYEEVLVSAPVSAQFASTSILMSRGSQITTSVQLKNGTGESLTASWSVNAPTGITVTPTQGKITLPAGGVTTVRVALAAASDVAPGVQSLDFAFTATGGNSTYSGDSALSLSVAYSSLADAFNNVGITDDSAPTAGNFDGSNNSYSVQAIAAQGVTPGGQITHDGATLTWPSAAAGSNDNVQVAGQTIALNGSGSKLVFLLAGTHGTATGTGTITYTDGTTQSFGLAANNWTIAAAGSGVTATGSDGDDAFVTTAHWNPTNSADGDYEVAVFGYTAALDASKTVAYVTFPAVVGGGDGSGLQTLHIFAMAIGS
jgi:beta-glucosidase